MHVFLFSIAGALTGLLWAQLVISLPASILIAYTALGGAQEDGRDMEPAPALTRTNFIWFVATTALIWTFCAWHWGIAQNGLTALAWAIFYSALLTLAVIDLRDYLLPDAITQPLIWIGLLVAGAGLISTPVNNSVQGAVAGYVGLWAVSAAYALATGNPGMGRGDFKLMAMLGAWLGVGALLPLALAASLACLTVAAIRWLLGKDQAQEVPFGPYLAAAALIL